MKILSFELEKVEETFFSYVEIYRLRLGTNKLSNTIISIYLTLQRIQSVFKFGHFIELPPLLYVRSFKFFK